MFSAGLSSGQAGGSGTTVRLLGGLSLRVVCQPALSRMSSACADGAADRLEMRLHGLGVSLRHDEGNAGVAARADGAEYIAVLVALIFGLAWARSFPGPLMCDNPSFFRTRPKLTSDRWTPK